MCATAAGVGTRLFWLLIASGLLPVLLPALSQSIVSLNPGAKEYAGKFTVSPSNILVIGESVTLNCSAKSGPQADIPYVDSYISGLGCITKYNIQTGLTATDDKWRKLVRFHNYTANFARSSFTTWNGFNRELAKFYCCNGLGFKPLNLLIKVKSNFAKKVVVAERDADLRLRCNIEVFPLEINNKDDLGQFYWARSLTPPTSKLDLKNIVTEQASRSGGPPTVAYSNQKGHMYTELNLRKFDYRNDGGLYTCYHKRTAFFSTASVTHDTIYVYAEAVIELKSKRPNTVVVKGLDISTPMNTVYVRRGTTVQLICTAAGYPTPSNYDINIEAKNREKKYVHWSSVLGNRATVLDNEGGEPGRTFLAANITDDEAEQWDLRCRVNQSRVYQSGLPENWGHSSLLFHFVTTDELPATTTTTPTPSFGPNGPSKRNEGNGGGSGGGLQPQTIYIAILIPVGVLIVIVASILIYRWRKSKEDYGYGDGYDVQYGDGAGDGPDGRALMVTKSISEPFAQ